jgi:hypothetical protein
MDQISFQKVEYSQWVCYRILCYFTRVSPFAGVDLNRAVRLVPKLLGRSCEGIDLMTSILLLSILLSSLSLACMFICHSLWINLACNFLCFIMIRFVELGSILEPGRPPKTDKAAVLLDAVRMVTQLRGEAQKLKDSNSSLQEKIKELKVSLFLFLWEKYTYSYQTITTLSMYPQTTNCVNLPPKLPKQCQCPPQGQQKDK